MSSLSTLQIAMVAIMMAMIASIAVSIVFLRAAKRRSDPLVPDVEQAVPNCPQSEASGVDGLNLEYLLDIRPLTPMQRNSFVFDWLRVQAQFTNDPAEAVHRADELLSDIMALQGYPLEYFKNGLELNFDELPVQQAEIIWHYRIAHDITVNPSRHESRFKALRRAMVYYRTLFDDLVNEPIDFSPLIEQREGSAYGYRSRG